jgi:hypothetical protein
MITLIQYFIYLFAIIGIGYTLYLFKNLIINAWANHLDYKAIRDYEKEFKGEKANVI